LQKTRCFYQRFFQNVYQGQGFAEDQKFLSEKFVNTRLQSIRMCLLLRLDVLEGPGCWLQGGGVLHVAAKTCPVR
jgi:hypothetical protein